jgi:hypothetical protein
VEASALSVRQLLLIAAGLALVAGVIALLVARASARGTGFRPTLRGGATVVASDTGAGASVLLSDPALGLRGRPDYLLEEEAGRARILVPLEIKPTRRSQRLYESDAVQVGAYVIAVRAMFGSRAADFGYVRYSERSFRVLLTEHLERRVHDIVARIRLGRTLPRVRRTHNVRARCAGCAMRARCDEALS